MSGHHGHALWPRLMAIVRTLGAFTPRPRHDGHALWPSSMARRNGQAQRPPTMARRNGHHFYLYRLVTLGPRTMATHDGHARWPVSLANTEASECEKLPQTGHARWPLHADSEDIHIKIEGIGPPPLEPGGGGMVISTASREQNTKFLGHPTVSHKLYTPLSIGGSVHA